MLITARQNHGEDAKITEWKESKMLNYRRLRGGVISANGKGLIDSEWDRKHRGKWAIFKCELVHGWSDKEEHLWQINIQIDEN